HDRRLVRIPAAGTMDQVRAPLADELERRPGDTRNDRPAALRPVGTRLDHPPDILVQEPPSLQVGVPEHPAQDLAAKAARAIDDDPDERTLTGRLFGRMSQIVKIITQIKLAIPSAGGVLSFTLWPRPRPCVF